MGALGGRHIAGRFDEARSATVGWARCLDGEWVAWNDLHARFTMHRINHQEAYSLAGGIYTNNAESFFLRMRRAEIGHHHHLAGPYLARFAQESAWREDHRRDPNGSQVDRVATLAMQNPPSVDFCGYWQRSWAP